MKIFNSPKKNRRRNRSAGFTLIEILLVVAIIALLAGVAIVNVGQTDTSSRIKIAKTEIMAVKTPLFAYNSDMGGYPSTEEGLAALFKAPQGKESKWHGPYTTKSPEDPWGNAFQYSYPATRSKTDPYDIWSMGPDGQSGTADDIGNWETTETVQ